MTQSPSPAPAVLGPNSAVLATGKSAGAQTVMDPADDGEIFVDEQTPWIPIILSPPLLAATSGVAIAASVAIGVLNGSRGPVTATILAVLAAVLVFLAVIDARTLRLPNPIVFSLYGFLGVGIVAALFSGEVAPDAALVALASMAGAFAFWWLTAFAMGGVGFGDIKLAGAMGLGIGLIGPWSAAFGTVLIPTIIGGAVSLVLVAIGKRNMGIPFGPFLAAGGILIMAFPGQFLAGLF